MTFAGVEHVTSPRSRRRQRFADRFDGGAGERDVVAHLVDVAAFAAKIELHIDNNQRGVRGPQVAVEWIVVRISLDRRHRDACQVESHAARDAGPNLLVHLQLHSRRQSIFQYPRRERSRIELSEHRTQQ